ncbi:amino acid transporter [Taibaiella sp. KBW10]|uniref:amino acid permease n=1 Tax=Taibaiella sp. KBW10 TaxID=2153357 RepID=UPI000F5ABFDF|nr:amino acid permease [Taibaiella sp. KBW10]RQO32198.1 amino acid transporter [Taibaiella sp. KBW10]
MFEKLLRKKTIAQLQETADLMATQEQHSMKKTLKARDLTMMGIAAVIGAGIFSTIGDAAFKGGPGVIFLFIITAVTCGFTALCYAEFSARIPLSGSAYTYSYVAFGELFAWIIGWALILEYAIGNIVVAISWSGYFNNMLHAVNIHLPEWLIADVKTAKAAFAAGLDNIPARAWKTAPMLGDMRIIMNLPAFVIVVIVTILAYIGIRESKKSANAMVIVKLLILVVVIAVGFFYINTDNYTPFMPNGFKGVLSGVSAVFYAYIGFDAISTTAEECENPQRDMPRGMIYSLIICTVIYVVTALVITGMVHYSKFQHITDPLAFVFEEINKPVLGKIISFSAVVAATSVMLVFQIGQPRIWMSMSRDGLLPKRFGKLHPKYKTPAFSTVITGLLVAVPALFIDASIVTDLTSIGTLFAFVLVCGGVLRLPKAGPQQRFKLPYVNSRYIIPVLLAVFLFFSWSKFSLIYQHIYDASYHDVLFVLFVIIATAISVYATWKQYTIIPVLGLLCCLYLMIEIPKDSWIVFLCWMGFGLLIYSLYGYRRSKLKAANAE